MLHSLINHSPPTRVVASLMRRGHFSSWSWAKPHTPRSKGFPNTVRTPSHAIGPALAQKPDPIIDNLGRGEADECVAGLGRRSTSEVAHLDQFRSHYLPRSRSVDFDKWVDDWSWLVPDKRYTVQLTLALSGEAFQVNGTDVVLCCGSDVAVAELFSKVSRLASTQFGKITLQYDMLLGKKLHTKLITADLLKCRSDGTFPALFAAPLSCLFFTDYNPTVRVVVHSDEPDDDDDDD